MTGTPPTYFALMLIGMASSLMAVERSDEVRAERAEKNGINDGRSGSLTSNPETPVRTPRTSPARVVFITSIGCERCEKELARLRRPGGDFETMRSLGWKIGSGPENHIQIVDRNDVPDVVKLLVPREYPAVACLADGEIIRSFKDGCSTPLDAWTFGWLIKGQNERPQESIPEAIRVETTGNYRLRGNHWSLEDDPNPTKQAVVNHLRGPNHAHASVSYGTFENWSYEELRSLHDDLHEREGGTVGQFTGQAQPAAANRSLDSFSGGRKLK